MPEKAFFVLTHGRAHPERSSLPFVMALAALASHLDAVIGLQTDGVEVAVKGCADTMAAPGFPPLAELMSDYRKLGGKILILDTCVKGRKIDADTQLVDNAEVVSAARFMGELSSATRSLTY